jgi:glucoamylase
MLDGFWSTGVKQFFGTAYEAYDSENTYSEKSATAPVSKVWFTGGQGVLTEVFWPTVDIAQVRDSQLLVTDGKSYFFEERANALHRVEWLETGVPAYRVVTQDPGGRFEIERTVFSDPNRDVVFQHFKVTQKNHAINGRILDIISFSGNCEFKNKSRIDSTK